MFFSIALANTVGAACRDTPCYYQEFDPSVVPWVAPLERNFEEVFKRYRYFSVRNLDDGHLEVSEHIRGEPVSVTRYRLDKSAALIEVDKQSRIAGSGIYRQHCAGCHGQDRLGGSGPALLPGNLGRLRAGDAAKVIRAGRPATQMPPFGQLLSGEEIDSLVKEIYTAPAVSPEWNADDIQASHVLLHAPGVLPDKPVFDADPLNIFMVVEKGDHHVTVLDGDRLEPIHRFPTRFALHGGLKYSPDGRFVYLASRDGWISKYDLYNLKIVAEIRAGINTRNVAVSGDGKTVLAGNYLPHTLVLLNADDLSLIRVIPVRDDDGKTSRVSAVYQAAPRGSFIAALKDIPEVWELHSEKPGFPLRRIKLERVLDDFFFDSSYRLLIGADRAEAGGQIVELDSGKPVAQLPLDGMPHLGSGIIWKYRDTQVLATPNLKSGKVTVIDMQDWKVVREIETLGPGFFMRSHENTHYAWVDVFFGPNSDVMHVIDKRTLEIVRTLRPAPGKTSGHVEFTRDGRFALVSLWEDEGALVVYDAGTLEEVRRIPMRKPSGKYNVYNKITRSEGTSH
jgi:mono/diheme cytochrome c family protein